MSQPDTLTQDVQHVPIDRVRAHPANPREGDVGAIWESIQENGFFGALVVQESSGCILAGNHRWMAAKEAGMQEVPVIYVDVDDERAMRILLADNRTNDVASYDGETLADLLEHLESTDEGLAGTGYDGDALDELLHDLGRLNGEPVEDPGAETDRADELREKWQTERGQLWQVGRHRLLCGDSTDAEDVERLLDGGDPRLMVTDPPYNVSADGRHDSYEMDAGKAQDFKEFDDGFSPTSFLAVWQEIGVENWFVFTGSYLLWSCYMPWFHERYKTCGIFTWVKKFAQSNVRGVSFAKATEFAVYAWDKGHTFNARSGKDNYDYEILASNEGGRSYNHPTAKPLDLITRPILQLSDQSDLIIDPFCGSGTTVIAAENEGRTCYAMEIDPAYCAVILERCTKAGLECTLVE